MGSIFFVAFVNDICSCVSDNVQLKRFAGDSKIHTLLDDINTSSCLQLSLENILQVAELWQRHRASSAISRKPG